MSFVDDRRNKTSTTFHAIDVSCLVTLIIHKLGLCFRITLYSMIDLAGREKLEKIRMENYFFNERTYLFMIISSFFLVIIPCFIVVRLNVPKIVVGIPLLYD